MLVAIRSSAISTPFDIPNTLICDTTGSRWTFRGANGSVSFTTVADAGSVNGTSPVAINCSLGSWYDD